MNIVKLLAPAAACVLASSVAEAGVLHVPDGYPTIQAGLEAAVAGDTVLVGCGTYYEHGLVMTSGVTLTSETGFPDCVTIDAVNLDRVIDCFELDETSTIQGLTIKNGRNHVSSPTELGGGGVRCWLSSVRVLRCAFIDNYSALTGGGGLAANPLPLYVESCVFVGNSTDDAGGGAIFSQVGATQITDCQFEGNTAKSGGAVATYLCEATIEDCAFVGNSTHWYHGGAIDLYSCDAAISRCTFIGNTATAFGGGIHCNFGSDAAIVNCTFAHNTAEDGAGVATGINSHPTVENSIIAFSFAGGAVYCHDYDPGTISLACCDLYGNTEGDWVDCGAGQQGVDGNFSEDPMFCGDAAPGSPYALELGSPCAAENSQGCGLLGAWDVGCISPVNSRSWGQIKTLYR